ncbi:MAG: hypothetical protein RMJ17_01455 [Candidatus Aenigmarchaeota archaeon]|nr:hypothetical protein [Candidatus Aenigmarchaeota archaeon]MDW8149246.1 hypothetical protein [Candidatus Aenigmarchaeota archaeon]
MENENLKILKLDKKGAKNTSFIFGCEDKIFSISEKIIPYKNTKKMRKRNYFFILERRENSSLIIDEDIEFFEKCSKLL